MLTATDRSRTELMVKYVERQETCLTALQFTTIDGLRIRYARSEEKDRAPFLSERGEDMNDGLFSLTSVMKLALFVLTIAFAAGAQTAKSGHPTTDAEKIADAISAGPPFITKD